MGVFVREVKIGGQGLEVSALFFEMQEAAAEQSRLLGWGYEDMKAHGVMWVVTRYQLQIRRWPAPGETVTVLTWPGDTRHGMYLRYFRVTEGEELLMEGSSLWAVVDRESRKMLQPSQSGVEIPAEHTGLESRPPMAPKRREAPQTGAFRVPADYLDGNGHMNNTRYFDLGQRELGMAKESLGELRAEFANEALLGDQLRLGRVREEGLGYLSGESDRAGACFRMEWRERGV